MVLEMKEREVQKFLEPQFGFLGKSSGEQLWMHHYTVWRIFKKFAAYIPSLNEHEREFIEVACLLHDVAKRSELNQRILRGEESDKILVIHKPKLEEVQSYLELAEDVLPFPITKDNIKTVFDIIVTHHSISEEDLQEITTDSVGILTELLRYSDWLASMDSVSSRTINEIRKVTKGLFDLTYFEISRFPAPSTYLFLDGAIKIYDKKGWKPLVVFDNGVVFIGEKCEIPQKDELVNSVLSSFFNKSLRLQSVYPVAFTKNILGGLSEMFPLQFMLAGDHEQQIRNNLGNIERKGVQFLRLLFDIFNLKDLNRLKKEIRLWNLIPACLGPSGHPKAKELWRDFFDEDAPLSINTEVITSLLDKIRIKDIIPERFGLSVAGERYLSTLTPEELFSLLYAVARDLEEEVADKETLRSYLEDLLSLEEEKDFKKAAEAAFGRYCVYKRTTDASKGLCERCGCPVSIVAKPALMFPRGSGYGFSQIKANPRNASATCPLCAYDNMILREGLRSNDQRIYVRIESKIPELLKQYPSLLRLITTLQSGLRYPRAIMKLEEREDFNDLPFPKRVTVPIAKEDYGEAQEIISTERGALFNIERTSMKDLSPKDFRVKYEPLYHLLTFLGFQTNIGTEEQVGLFGEALIPTENAYHKSLAVIILSAAIGEGGKKQNRYIFAKNLQEQSPSVALRIVSESSKLNERLIMRYFEFLRESGIVLFDIEGGGYQMKDLLKDAAFFADRELGIPHFCVEPEERYEWRNPRNITRHKAAKPVSDALNEMLKGGDEGAFERAVAAFLRNLAKKIKEEEKETQTEFVEKSTKILEKFWDLRKADISEFIRAKNALTSSIFVFTRYENLKEVVRNE